jgi:hypothetical protein
VIFLAYYLTGIDSAVILVVTVGGKSLEEGLKYLYGAKSASNHGYHVCPEPDVDDVW